MFGHSWLRRFLPWRITMFEWSPMYFTQERYISMCLYLWMDRRTMRNTTTHLCHKTVWNQCWMSSNYCRRLQTGLYLHLQRSKRIWSQLFRESVLFNINYRILTWFVTFSCAQSLFGWIWTIFSFCLQSKTLYSMRRWIIVLSTMCSIPLLESRG